MKLEEKVTAIIRDSVENGQDAEITPASRLGEDLGVDSLNVLMILFELEKEFAVSLEESDFTRVKTVADVVARVRARSQAAGVGR